MPALRVQNFGGSLKILFADNTELVRNKRSTFLSEDVVTAATTIRVQSIAGFEQLSTSSGQVVLIGNFGDERSEIRVTSTATSPSAAYKEVTLGAAIDFDHPQDTKVTIMDWNRIEFQYAATVTGTKTTIAAYPSNIAADQKETSFRDTTDPTARLSGFSTAAYYFARFNATPDSRNTDWSDAVYGTGYNDNTVFAIKKRALDEMGEKIDDEVITHEFLNQVLWEARREYHQSPGKRPFRRKYNVDIGNVVTGSYRIELPTDVEEPSSGENIYGVRVANNANMSAYDKKEFDFDYRNIPHTTLAHAYTAGTSTSIWLASGRDFPASVTINVEGQEIGLTRVEGYTGDALLSSFRIYSHPSGAWDASIGSDVWSNATLGLPDKYIVFADPDGSAYVYFNRPFSTTYVSQNIYADYYRTLLGRDSDGDVLDEPSYDMYVPYLKAKIRQKRSRGELQLTEDPDFQLWLVKKQESLAKEFLGVDINIFPDIDHLGLPQ